jgi:hypothetical protein
MRSLNKKRGTRHPARRLKIDNPRKWRGQTRINHPEGPIHWLAAARCPVHVRHTIEPSVRCLQQTERLGTVDASILASVIHHPLTPHARATGHSGMHSHLPGTWVPCNIRLAAHDSFRWHCTSSFSYISGLGRCRKTLAIIRGLSSKERASRAWLRSVQFFRESNLRSGMPR